MSSVGSMRGRDTVDRGLGAAVKRGLEINPSEYILIFPGLPFGSQMPSPGERPSFRFPGYSPSIIYGGVGPCGRPY